MGGKTISNSETRLEALRLQSSAYGVTIPVLGGVNRIAGNLIWYGDFKAIPHTSTQGGGGKGGVKVTNTTYTYSASVLMGVCQGRVGAIARVWKGKEVFSGGWSAANVNNATETYTPPGSGAMTYTLIQAATLIGAPTISAVLGRFRLQLALGTDYSVSAGVVTVLASRWRGVALTIKYSWGTGSPDVSALAQLGITLLSGDSPQTTPAWLSSAHPSEALNYPGLALVHAQDYDLGSAGSVENHSFEVQGSGAYRYGSTSPDCNPWEFLADVLANARYGARMPSETIEVQGAIDYCAAAGLLMSPVLTEQASAAELVERMCALTNCAAVWTFDHLRIVPYGDTALTGNGVTYTPNTTPLYDLNDDGWLDAENPVEWVRKEPSDRYNHVRVEFSDRANYYNKNIAEAFDDADIALNGRRSKPEIIKAPWICDAAVARLVAQIEMQRSLNISGTGSCKLPWVFCLLECMDLVTITETVTLGFNQLPVRVTAVGEDEDGTLEIEFEEWPLGVASPTRYPSQVASGYQHDYNAAPGSVQTPVIFEAPGALTQNGLELWVATTGLNANWGGCRVWVSLDGTQYKQVAVLNGGSRYGSLSASAGSTGGFAVTLQKGQLLGGTAADAAARNTLCYVGGAAPEFFSFQTATLTGPLAYTLGGTMQRGQYGTAGAAHAPGAPFVRCDDALARSGPIDLSYIGRTVYLKFTSFNIYGGAEQDLASVSAYTYAVTGANLYGNAAVAAQATADGKVTTFRQSTPPTAEGYGDLWIDTANGNRMNWWDGTAWVPLPLDTGAISAGAVTEVDTLSLSNITVTGQPGTGPQGYSATAKWTPLGTLTYTADFTGDVLLNVDLRAEFSGHSGVFSDRVYCELRINCDFVGTGSPPAAGDEFISTQYSEVTTSSADITSRFDGSKLRKVSVTSGTSYTWAFYAQTTEPATLACVIKALEIRRIALKV